MEFRDVFEVDGSPVRERDQRLVKMFLEPSPSTSAADPQDPDGERALQHRRHPAQRQHADLSAAVSGDARITTASSSSGRAIGRRPTPAAARRTADGAFRVSTEVWVIAYEEKASHTMIRTDGEKDLPSKGRFWIDPATGRVLMSELTVENRNIRAIIDVSYQSEPLLGLLVPIEMRERYESQEERLAGRGTCDLRQVPAVPGEGRRKARAGRSNSEPQHASHRVCASGWRSPASRRPRRRSRRWRPSSSAPAPTSRLVERSVSGIVAEERYDQQWTVLPRGMSTNEQRHRELVSDLLIVKLESAGLVTQFRDVFDVDGAPVRDRDERLMKLFLQPTQIGGRAGRSHPDRERPLQHRQHRAERQHAAARDVLPRPAQSAALPLLSHEGSQPGARGRRRCLAGCRRTPGSCGLKSARSRPSSTIPRPTATCRRTAASGSTRRPAGCS